MLMLTHGRTLRAVRCQVSMVGLALVVLMVGSEVRAQAPTAEVPDLSLEDLMNVEVTSVSRRAERLSSTAASVFVLTADDIRRSGSRTIPAALRLVPGLHVGQIDANGWSVSVRGFGGRFSNKLLVLVDGQSVYSPLFSGVIWNMVSVSLDEIDRIEIIRGPGATLWGANAVNGVINIITRSAAASQGGLFVADAGNAGSGGSLRYGGTMGARTNYRVDVNGFSRNGTSAADGVDLNGNWRGRKFGVRVDSELGARSKLTLIGGAALTRADEAFGVPSFQPPYMTMRPEESRHESTSLLSRWETETVQGGTTSVQFIAERTGFLEVALEEDRTTFDVEVQQTRTVANSQHWLWGVTYRRSSDWLRSGELVQIAPERQVIQLWSGFVQNDIAMFADRARLTLGTKIEHNDYTGWELQPNARVRVDLTAKQSIWGAAARAVRLPSRVEVDGSIAPTVLAPSIEAPLPQLIRLGHGPVVKAEVLRSYELGYRLRPLPSMSIDLSAFVNHYSGLLLTGSVGAPALRFAPVPHVEIPLFFDNFGKSRTIGGEVAVDWRPVPELRLQGGYSGFGLDWIDNGNTGAMSGAGQSGDYPHHQFHLRGSLLLLGRVELDGMARHVGELGDGRVAPYVTVDARAGTALGPLEVAIVARNLIGANHSEYLPDVLFTPPALMSRTVDLQIRWTF